ncbi:MAG TPA: hypothetical protein P5267_02345 [Patescibacteria group bacterium]|nr:hypothetical protein [Patescibacteria group bacterium]
MAKYQLPEKEWKILKKLDTPVKIQNFLDDLKINFEEDGDTYLSPMTVLERGICHCAEGAILAALALRINGWPPLLMDLKTNKNDIDHVVAVFRKAGKWGAISKTNHAVLRYREPIYASPRELAMSYFHEYFDNRGRKNLRSFSRLLNLARFDRRGWMATREEVGYIPDYLDGIKHFPILNKKQIRGLRLANQIEIAAGKLVEWKKGEKKKEL